MKFLSEFNKETQKMKGVLTTNEAPRFWVGSGNHTIDKIISGDYQRGYAQGRLSAIAGPSSAGKSYLIGNSIKSAQDQGCGILVIDSEHALDEDYLHSIGVNTDSEDFVYRGVKTISQASAIVSKFISLYRESGSTDKFLIAIDSIDNLMTDSELAIYERGDTGNDQGQHAKQCKRMLGTFMHDIKDLNIVILCTKQVYPEQDPIKARSMPYIITESFRFAFSQILLITKLILRDAKTKEQNGITMKVFGYKTRFTKPFQQCKIEVPYDTGMNKFSGILDVAVSKGIVVQNGAWNTYKGNKFYEKDFDKYADEIFRDLCSMDDDSLNIEILEKEDTGTK